MKNRVYIAIDLKSFYASVECMERGLDPMTTNLVVADPSRTEKTICLAVSPSLKSYGISGRARLFEVVQKVKEANAIRKRDAPKYTFTGSSYSSAELSASPELALDYITAPPRMARYIACSTKIYNIYLKYVAPADMRVYSIDEVFMDVTAYLETVGLSPRELAMKIILDVLTNTGITATAGIGTNLYLSKVAMDIEAKRTAPDENGVRIAELDELSYRRSLWTHQPLTDFWRVGRGYAKKLEEQGLLTMGDIARCSIGKPDDYHNETLLYKMFGINAELLIDHAWGFEPCTMEEIKAYKPSANGIGSGQVLCSAYPSGKAGLIVREMTDRLALMVGYDIDNLKDANRMKRYRGDVSTDYYGRAAPKPAHGSINLGKPTSSTKEMLKAMSELFDRIVDPNLLVRRVNITANHVIEEVSAVKPAPFEQIDWFTDYDAARARKEKEEAALAHEKRIQKTILMVNKKFGKNALLKGMNLQEGAMTMERNKQIGGHKA